MKKILCLFLTLFISVSIIIPSNGEKITPEYDVVFLLDCSGSMETADPERNMLYSVQMFADLFTGKNSRIGYILFGAGVHTQKCNLNSIEIAKGFIADYFLSQKETIYSIEGLSEKTNIPAGLDAALSMFNSDKSGRQQICILFTDGNIDMPNTPEGWADAGDAEGRRQALGTAKAFKNANIPIYTVGLNYDGNLDADFLKEISNTSKPNGISSPNYIIEKGREIPEIFSEIYSNLFSCNGAVTLDYTGDITHTASYYIESEVPTNILSVILYGENLSNFVIKKPNGEIYQDSNFTKRGKYNYIQLHYPETGQWQFEFSGDAKVYKLQEFGDFSDTVKITFDCLGIGVTDFDNSLEILNGTSYAISGGKFPVPALTDNSLTFLYWSLSPTADTEIPKDYTFTTDKTVYAKIVTAELYKVDFLIGDNFTETVSLNNTERLYTAFDNFKINVPRGKFWNNIWYMDSNFAQPVDGNIFINSDITLYGKFEKIPVGNSKIILSVIFLIFAIMTAFFVLKFTGNNRNKNSKDMIFATGGAVIFGIAFSLFAGLLFSGYFLPIDFKNLLPQGAENFLYLWFLILIPSLIITSVIVFSTQFGKTKSTLKFWIPFGISCWIAVVVIVIFNLNLNLNYIQNVILLAFAIAVYPLNFFISTLLVKKCKCDRCRNWLPF